MLSQHSELTLQIIIWTAVLSVSREKADREVLRREQLRAVDGDEVDKEGVERDFFEISDQEADLRLDKVLTNRYDGFSRNYFGELITSHKVTVDGEVLAKKAAKLKEGSKVEVTFTETKCSRVDQSLYKLHVRRPRSTSELDEDGRGFQEQTFSS
mmetsp:Transcript_12997/g.18698  ORF Transcript_12997/g.18698 Transcript_12997/m.18698 type:complete len:155 (-) Transcript_12997:159-623(-)